MRAVIVLTTAPDAKTGGDIARFLLKKKLAACVSVKEGFSSIYRWKGKVEQVKESLLLIKTSEKNFSRVRQAVEKIHPYETPEILAVPVIKGSKKYLAWIADSVK